VTWSGTTDKILLSVQLRQLVVVAVLDIQEMETQVGLVVVLLL
jgi:hypothetical protein